ncbi:hypothetical protein [Streptomyces sp. NPDC002215]|uniref:hypothetical protein n=1 Tax=Streptomyces sp. NPDC002215 TaxID=3154412 RepID=UPI00331E6666
MSKGAFVDCGDFEKFGECGAFGDAPSGAEQDATGGNESLPTLILLAWGVGTLAGNINAGRLVDRHDSARVLTGALALAALALALTPPATRALAPALVRAAVWGVSVGVSVVPQQHRLIALSPAAAPVLLGLNSSALYIGVALGGGFGGRVAGAPSRCRTDRPWPTARRHPA